MLRKSLIVFVILVLMLEPASLGLAQSSQIIRVSVAAGGGEPNGNSFDSSISSNGRYVAFASDASDLVAGEDSNGAADIFVRDLQYNTTTIASIPTVGGWQANNGSSNPAISQDGYVAFESYATNLVPEDTNGDLDIFVRDLNNNTTTRVSVMADGAQANGPSFSPDISLDGSRIVFMSTANLTAMTGDDDNDADVFVRDLGSNTTIRVSVAADGGEGWGSARYPSISADGRYVAFESDSPNLVAGDTNNKFDIFVRDLQENTTTRVSIATDGTQANDHSLHPDISCGGDMVTFESYASNLVSGDTNGKVDIFVRDLLINDTERVSMAADGTQANNDSSYPVVAASLQWYYVAFESYATNLVPGGTENVKNVFLYSGNQSTSLVSLTYLPPNDPALAPAISCDGRYVTFHTANAVIEGETDNWISVYRYEVTPPAVSPIVVSVTRVDPDPTTASYVRFDVTFSEAVTGVDSVDFVLTATGTITGARVSSIAEVSPEKYQVTVYTGGGNGTLRLDVPVTATITDLDDNALASLPYTSGEAYTLERPVAIVRADANPTSAASVRFNVIFAENALDVATDDFSIRETETLTGSSITSVSGSGWFYEVTVQTGSGNGTLHLDIPETATILDEEYNNLLAGLLPYTQGEAYDVIKSTSGYNVFLPLVLRR